MLVAVAIRVGTRESKGEERKGFVTSQSCEQENSCLRGNGKRKRKGARSPPPPPWHQEIRVR
jgi:hypothetical protein